MCPAPRSRRLTRAALRLRPSRKSRNVHNSRQSRKRTTAELAEARQDLALVEVQEPLLVGTDLVHVDVRVAGVLEALDHLEVAIRVGAARHELVDVLG